MGKCIVLLLILALAPGLALGKVERSADSGFEIRIEAVVSATPEAVYAQFLRVGEWWNQDHTWFGKSEGLFIEPRAGGCFCERSGDNTALHMIVSLVSVGREIRMIGGLGPLSGLGLHGAMSWTFEPAESGMTKITHIYRVTGYYPDGLTGLATIVDSVQSVQVAGLAARFDP